MRVTTQQYQTLLITPSFWKHLFSSMTPLSPGFPSKITGHSSPPLVPSHWLFLSCLKFSRSLKNISFFSILFPSSPLALNTTYLFTLDLCREIQTRITNCVLDIFHLFNRQLQPNVQNITLNCLPHTSFSYAYIFLISGNATTST